MTETKLRVELIEKIKESNNIKKSGIIIQFLEFISEELKKFEYHPKKIDFNSEEYENAFEKAKKKLEKVEFRPFSVIGLKGSVVLKKEHDIDIIFIPKEGITGGLLLAAGNEFERKLKEEYKSRFKKRIIIFPFNTSQEEIEYLSKRKDDELFLHFVYVCENFYGKNIGNPEGIKTWIPDFVLFNEGKTIEDIKDTKYDRMIMVLETLDLFCAEYPKELLKKKTHLFNYVAKILKTNFPAKKIKDQRLAYQILCLLFDYVNSGDKLKWKN